MNDIVEKAFETCTRDRDFWMASAAKLLSDRDRLKLMLVAANAKADFLQMQLDEARQSLKRSLAYGVSVTNELEDLKNGIAKGQ